MSHERLRTDFTSHQMLRITDDDGDRMSVAKNVPTDGILGIECVSAYTGSGAGVSLNMSDARALRRFLNEFIGKVEDDDE